MPPESPRVRVDTGVREGDEISPFYDPMLAKLIVWGEDRAAACAQMRNALGQCEVVGVATNIAFLERVVAHAAFADARLDTGLIEANREALFPAATPTPEAVLVAAAAAECIGVRESAAAAARASGDAHSPWHEPDAWRVSAASPGLRFTYADGDARHEVRVDVCGEHDARVGMAARAVDVHFAERDDSLILEFDGAALAATVIADGDQRHVFVPGARRRLTFVDPLAHAGEVEVHGGHLTAPMSGAIVAVMVKAGDKVVRGAPLIVLEAMKMEHTIVAPADGVVASVHFGVGDRVAEGADLVDLEDT
jgi:3-methylcrotonyl-CoA carboxylase alpha subunit